MSSNALTDAVRHLRGRLAAVDRNEECDEQLLHAFTTRRDEDAFAVLVRRHGPMVLRVCRRVLGQQQDAEDAFQAVFLLLARKAAGLRNKTALAGFLHGIAYRIALTAKRSAVRRRKHECRATTRPLTDPTDELSWREVRTLLEEEIARLPEKYRVVFVLFHLENLSREETARRLGLKDATVAKRLSEARKWLGQRLSRRGVELTAVLATTAAAQPPASALPAELMATTIKAALATAAGERLAGIVSTSVAQLVQSATTAMMLSKVKIATVILLTVSLLAGASAWAYRSLTANAPAVSAQAAALAAAKANDKLKATPPQPEAAKTDEIQGRVLGPDGKPKAGTKLLLLDEDEKLTELGVTAMDGRFRVAVPKEPKFNRLFRYLVAQADGAGIDFIDLGSSKPGKPVELRLVKDNVIRGRIVNTEGKPVAGVRVVARTITTYIGDSLDTFLAGYIKILAGGKGHGNKTALWYAGGTLFTAVTDADGRFVLSGIGSERTAELHFSGGGIANTSLLYVVNRAGFDPKPYNQEFRDYFTRANKRKDQSWIPAHLLYGPDISVFAETEKIIRGTVTDADTDKGVAGLEIRLIGYWDNLSPPSNPTAKTDAEGRYEIHGPHKAQRYLVQFMGDAITGYTPSQVWADDTTGLQPVVADLKLKKGVIVTGKVIDRATGKAIPGHASAAVLADNPFIKDYRYDKIQRHPMRPFLARSEKVDADGTFRLVTLPGPVLLMGGPDYQELEPLDAMKFHPAVPDPAYPQYFKVRQGPFVGDTRITYRGLEGFGEDVHGGFCKVLNVKPGVAFVKQDIILERDSSRRVKIQDSEGRPLSGVWVTGITRWRGNSATHLENYSCPVYHLEAGKPRLMVFCEPYRKLAGIRTLKGDEKQPILVKLGPAGSVKGRLLDADGKPLTGLGVDLHYRENEAQEIEQAIREGKQVITDGTGAFAFDSLIPEIKFELLFRRGRRPFQRETKSAETMIQIAPGECRDLGAIKLKQVAERSE